MEPDLSGLVNELCVTLGARPDRNGEVYVTCPWCGKGDRHFSFSERGAHCFVCGKGTSLQSFAQAILQRSAPPVYVPTAPVKKRRVVAEKTFAELVAGYVSSKVVKEAWQTYKPVTAAQICEYKLGFGAFPAHLSQCTHERLMVPIYEDGHLIGIRGRRLNCNCKKWLTAAGSRCALYNAHRLERARDGVVWVVENAIDAILLSARLHSGVAVATLGVGIWNADYTNRLREVAPFRVYVAYDNDRPGCGTSAAVKEDWLEAHPADIEPGGVRLVNRLLLEGFRNVEMIKWPKTAPVHLDVGELLLRGTEIRACERSGMIKVCDQDCPDWQDCCTRKGGAYEGVARRKPREICLQRKLEIDDQQNVHIEATPAAASATPAAPVKQAVQVRLL